MSALSTITKDLVSFETKYGADFKAACLINKNIGFLSNIYRNITIFQHMRTIAGLVFRTTGAGATEYYVRGNHIILYFVDIPLYIILPTDALKRFVSNIVGYEGNVMQLVYEGDVKRFVFICSDFDYIDAIMMLTRRCFNTEDVYIMKNQICVANVLHHDTVDPYITLSNYVKRYGTHACYESIHRIKSINYEHIEYVRCQCNISNGLLLHL